MTTEVGIPRGLAEGGQVLAGARHLKEAIDALRDYPLEQDWGSTRIVREPVGVCALLAPWNWPMNQVTCKVGPALAAGCTMVLKPSQLSPLSALLFAEAVDEAGIPAGVFNMVNGAGAALGDAFATHPLVDMVSLTGSTAVGGVVAAAAAPSIKRVSPGARRQVGQHRVRRRERPEGRRAPARSADAQLRARPATRPTRMLVAQEIYDEAVEVAARAADDVAVGDPLDEATFMGPVAGRKQFETVRGYIETGIDEGARLVAGGLERPDGLDKGFFVRPTVFADVTPDMRVFQEEIFGPVLCMTPFTDEAHAIELANATDVRPLRLRAVGRRGAGAPRREPHAHRHGAPQRRADRRPRALRRLQAVGQRPRVGPVRPRGLPRGQGRDGVVPPAERRGRQARSASTRSTSSRVVSGLTKQRRRHGLAGVPGRHDARRRRGAWRPRSTRRSRPPSSRGRRTHEHGERRLEHQLERRGAFDPRGGVGGDVHAVVHGGGVGVGAVGQDRRPQRHAARPAREVDRRGRTGSLLAVADGEVVGRLRRAQRRPRCGRGTPGRRSRTACRASCAGRR